MSFVDVLAEMCEIYLIHTVEKEGKSDECHTTTRNDDAGSTDTK